MYVGGTVVEYHLDHIATIIMCTHVAEPECYLNNIMYYACR